MSANYIEEMKVKMNKLLQPNDVYNDSFGLSVSLSESGKYMAVGCCSHNSSVVIYERVEDSWIEKLTIQDSFGFGYSVSFSGGDSKLFVGNYYDTPTNKPVIHECVLCINDGELVCEEIKRINLALKPFDKCSYVNVFSNNRGDKFCFSLGLATSKTVEYYVADTSLGSWSVGQKLDYTSKLNLNEESNACVINDDGTILALSSFEIGKNGKVLIYRYNNLTNKYEYFVTINAPGGELYESFGTALALNDVGDVVYIGCPDKNINGCEQSGIVCVYTYSEIINDYILSDMITPEEVVPYASFGTSISLDIVDGKLAVGSPGKTYLDDDDYSTGAIYYS